MTSARAWAWSRGAERTVAVAAAAVAIAASCLFFASAASALELNTANRAQLEQLRGIGVIAAERILTERSKGDFKSWEDFMRRVKGFKKASSERLSRDGLTVGGVAFTKPADEACVLPCGAGASTTPAAGSAPSNGR